MPAKPVALLGDFHTCPQVNPGPVPHIGGPIVSAGQTAVRVMGRPVAVVGASCACSCAMDSTNSGSSHVRIGGRPVCRIGDGTAHGGVIVMGSPTVRMG